MLALSVKTMSLRSRRRRLERNRQWKKQTSGRANEAADMLVSRHTAGRASNEEDLAREAKSRNHLQTRSPSNAAHSFLAIW